MSATNSSDMFSEPSDNSDIILLVEDKKIHVNKAILSLVSPVFAAMFELNFKEKFATEIPLPDKKYDDVVEFLRCVYPNTLKDVDCYNFSVVLPLADEYQVEVLKKRVKEFCLRKLDGEQQYRTLVEILYLSEKYELNSVLRKAISVAAKRKYSKIKLDKRFSDLGQNVVFQIIEERLITFEENNCKCGYKILDTERNQAFGTLSHNYGYQNWSRNK